MRLLNQLFLISVLPIATLPFTCFSQDKVAAIQKTIFSALKKVYPATIKFSEYNEERKTGSDLSSSGVVISKDGYILTAGHAVSPGKIYFISFPDGKTATASGLAKIGFLDAGSLKIREKGNYPYAEMGSSSSLVSGEGLLSAGFPATMHSGIMPIIRFGQLKTKQNNNGYIQSTCLMEPGDSGGPLFDLKGKIVGIHSHILASEEENFDVPIDSFKRYWPSVLKRGRYNRGQLEMESLSMENTLKSDPGPVFSYPLSDKKYQGLKSVVYALQSEMDQQTLKVNATLVKPVSKRAQPPGIYYLVTNSNMVGTKAYVIQGGSKIPAEVVKRDTLNNLVMLKVSGLKSVGQGITFDDKTPPVIPGTFVISPLPEEIKSGVIGSGRFRPVDADNLPKTEIIVQDALLSPHQCGGPLFDLELKFLGLNLTRHNRTSVVVVPNEVIYAFVNTKSVSPHGKAIKADQLTHAQVTDVKMIR